MKIDPLTSWLHGPSGAAVAVAPVANAIQPTDTRNHTTCPPQPSAGNIHRQASALQAQPVAESVQWHYQLQVSKPLPAIDLSRTLADLCSPKWRAWIIAFMSSYYRYIANIHRVASLLYFMLLILPPSLLRHAITSLVFFSIFTLTCTSLFLSLDVLSMLLRSSDVVFVSLINLLNWGCLAAMLGDVRAIVCVPSVYATQVGIFMDANFRTYPTVLRSIVASIPAVLSVALCCALDAVHHPKLRVVHIANTTISLANIITYTSMTISIFMAKKAFHKHKGSHTSVSGLHLIPCVLLRAKMKLSVFHNPMRERRQVGVTHESVDQLKLNPHLQRLHPSRLATSKIDATACLLPTCIGRWSAHDITEPLSSWLLVPLYAAALVGFVGLATQNLVLSQHKDYELISCSVSLVATVIFCGFLAFHFQRDLVLKLFTNFDFVFASFQVVVGTFCVADLNSRTGSACIKSVTWMVWFLWMLLLDALPPVMRQRLRFHKKLVIPVQIMLLVNTAWILVQILLDDDVGKNNRVLFQYQISAKQNYRLTTVSILVERLVTILGWCGSRIIADIFFADDDELLFLRGIVHYMSPYETFPPKATRVGVTERYSDPQQPPVRLIHEAYH